ncbi:hypothetical protein BACT_0858 [Bifidobacterium actinocoloniiforme DSM 22766]|uniref:DUF3710 domain-containing protein n=1 Tax=Bifidobacterium actinocoloniiforme DSM 22766 TaxID=1437605 RepID=A0A086Z0V6_9BIFI|nr:DUF3710 domain-containing protein [Bifidobacterium actinocoloniiforme]AKV55348.1 hypothetical protein AB656_02895 [Bifidobacterium actinocoloniiforme DSM 22766]KFI40156.1 hypothetical protein BACT_0858 [Bifidobacterium actinocoloniiforme DSM 22766]
MGLFGFGRKRKAAQDEDHGEAAGKADVEDPEQDARLTGQERGVDRGPWDVNDEDVIDYDDYLDIGSIFLPFLQGVQLRIKSSRESGEILAATVTFGKSSLELEAFAAPKTLGLWDLMRSDLAKANSQAKEVEGVFGHELLLPVTVKGKGMMTRFVGVDGPRWMLRGIFSGPATKGGKEKETLDRYFMDVVVDRGEEPLAPRDRIPMHAPVSPAERAAAKAEDEGAGEGEAKIPDKPTGPFDSDQQTEVKTTLSRGPMFSEVR